MNQFVPMGELLNKARQQGYAVPSFCVWNAESIQVVLETAVRMKAPVLLMNGPGEYGLLGPKALARMACDCLQDCPVSSALVLDHGDSVALARECLAAGYTSLMLDFSAKSFAENVAALRETVNLAHPRGISVEGEIGHVGRVDNISLEGQRASTLTVPEEAAEYVRQTGVDALAVSIGNSHGKYTKLPQFDFARLERIARAVSVPLVLHGGSGTPDEELRRSIRLGIAKVNVATDLVTAFRTALLEQWSAGGNLWAPQALGQAARAMVPAIERWIIRTGAAGMAK